MSGAEEWVIVPPNATLADAQDLFVLAKALDDDTELHFDAANVEGVCTPYVLTLVSTLRTRAGRTPPMVIHNSTDAFVDAFSDLGLFQDLMKMEFAT